MHAFVILANAAIQVLAFSRGSGGTSRWIPALAGTTHRGGNDGGLYLRAASQSVKSVPTSGWRSARSTVACKKPSLLPQS